MCLCAVVDRGRVKLLKRLFSIQYCVKLPCSCFLRMSIFDVPRWGLVLANVSDMTQSYVTGPIHMCHDSFTREVTHLYAILPVQIGILLTKQN